MVPVRVHELVSGRPLPHALYTRGGRLLAHSGTLLTPEMMTFLEAHRTSELRYDTRAEPVGVRPEIEGSEGHSTDGEDADRIAWERRLLRTRAELRRSASALVQVARIRWERLPRGVDVGIDPIPLAQSTARREGDAADIPTIEEPGLREIRATGVGVLRSHFARLIDGESVDAGVLYDLADDLLGALVHHQSLYSIPAMGMPRPCDSLPEHCYSTGALSLGIAAQLGWSRADVRNAAVAGFLADSGMALVPHPVRRAGRPLTDIELNAVRRHTEYGVGLLRGVRGLHESIVLTVYQHHERQDGSGYPLGVGSSKLHDLSRVVAVAETFAGMTAPRMHRPALTSHRAMSELAHHATAGIFDRHAVVAIVDLLGLYPARSFVRLSSGHVALVGSAANRGASDRPTVHVVQPAGSASRFGRAIDLARIEPKMLRIIEAIRTPEGVEV